MEFPHDCICAFEPSATAPAFAMEVSKSTAILTAAMPAIAAAVATCVPILPKIAPMLDALLVAVAADELIEASKPDITALACVAPAINGAVLSPTDADILPKSMPIIFPRIANLQGICTCPFRPNLFCFCRQVGTARTRTRFF
jgi:hypothetical protein